MALTQTKRYNADTGQWETVTIDDGSGQNGGSSGPSDKEKSYAEKLIDIAGHNRDALNDKFNHGKDVYDVSDEQSKKLWATQTEQNKRNSGDDWFSQIKKLQGSVDQLKGNAGGSMNGSNFYQMMDLIGRADNDIDNETLVNQRKNQDTINNDLFEALSASVNGRNELAADTEYAQRQIGTDTLAQIASINPDLYDQYTDWFNNGAGFYDNNKTKAADITKQGFYRENNAQAKANAMYTPKVPNASAANGNYWEKMLNGYK